MSGKLDRHVQKNETGPLSHTTHKTNSKWIKDLKVRPKTIKLLCSKLLDTDLGDDFFHLTPKTNAIVKINK